MVTLTDISALARWSDPQLAKNRQTVDPDTVPWWDVSARDITAELLREARLEAAGDRPLHVLVREQTKRARSKVLKSHVWKGDLPNDALFRITDDVLIVSPAFCLQQLSSRTSIPFAALVGMELCGGYGCSPNAGGGFHGRVPVATSQDLREYFSRSRGYGGVQALHALDYVADGSRSPMESILVLLFVLPVELGGCGMPMPRLNLRAEIHPRLQAALGKPYLTVDIAWPQWRSILEFDSWEFHNASPTQEAYTKARNEGLTDEGWMVRSVNAKTITDPALRKNLLDAVTRRAGLPLPWSPEYELRQQRLVNCLMARERCFRP